MTKPVGNEPKVEMVMAENMAPIAVAKLRELADLFEKNPRELEGIEYGMDPFNDEPRFQTLTVRWRLDEKART